MEIVPDDLGHAGLGEPQQGPELRAAQLRRPDRVLPRARDALQRAQPRASRSSASTASGTSRTSSSSSHRRSTRRAGPSPRRRTRSSTAPHTRASRAASPTAQVAAGETSPRGQGQAVARARSRTRSRRRPSPTCVPPASPRIKFDAWAHHPYSVLGQGPIQKARYPNVHLTTAPAVPEGHEEVVRPHGRHLDLRVRLRDEARRSPAASAVAAGRVRAADDQHAAGKPVREDARLVHLPGRPDKHVAERPPETATARGSPRSRRSPPARSPSTHGIRSSGRRSTRCPSSASPCSSSPRATAQGRCVGANIRVYGPNSAYFGNIQMQATIGTDGWATFLSFPAERHEARLLPLLRHPRQERQHRQAPGDADHRLTAASGSG